MNDSYSAARLHVMRTKLLRQQQYEQLLKMGDKEIIGFLQNTDYRQDIDAVALKDLENLEAIDQVIAHNTARELRKLKNISSPSYRKALQVILDENDRWNIKLIAEAIAGSSDPREALKRYGKTGTFDPQQFAGAKTIEELARAASRKIPSLRKRPTTLTALRDALQQESGMAHLLARMPRAQKYRVDEANLLRLLMLKRDKLAGQQIMARLKHGGTVDRSMLREAANAATPEDSLRVLRTTKYAKAIIAAQEQLQTGSLVRFEEELHAEVLGRMVREAVSAPLHVELLLRYLSEKEIEHTNIRLLVKGKRLHLEESFLREHLIMTT
jgi:V/A-type H+/Na+-transporting ATPase subunit C